MNLVKTLIFLFILTVILESCKIADISNPNGLQDQASEQRANEIFEKVLKKQGFNQLENTPYYSARVIDHWSGLTGKIASPWPDQKINMRAQFSFDTFDGNVLFINGSREGDLIGTQSWTYYEKPKTETSFSIKVAKGKAKKLQFGMVALHYFIELPYRLSKAPIKKYYGEKEHKGKKYDLIFSSWESEAANPHHDQYILWVNQETSLVDYCVFTIRDNKSPFIRHKYGSIAFIDYKETNGFRVPQKMPVMLDDQIFKKDVSNYFHEFQIRSFNIGGLNEPDIYPLKDIKKKGDKK